MKRVLILVFAISAILTSCSNNEQTYPAKDITVQMSLDTSIYTQVAKTAPRYGCNGKKLSQPKLVGYETQLIPIKLHGSKTLSGDSLQKAGWFFYPFGNGTTPGHISTFTWFPDWLITLLNGLCWLVIILICLGFTWILLSWLWGLTHNNIQEITKLPETIVVPTTTTQTVHVVGCTDKDIKDVDITGCTGIKNNVTFPSGNNNVYIFVGGNITGDITVEGNHVMTPKTKDEDTNQQSNK
ncbi:MAG: hypothetical protein WCQ32_00255 [bacterium]